MSELEVSHRRRPALRERDDMINAGVLATYRQAAQVADASVSVIDDLRQSLALTARQGAPCIV